MKTFKNIFFTAPSQDLVGIIFDIKFLDFPNGMLPCQQLQCSLQENILFQEAIIFYI